MITIEPSVGASSGAKFASSLKRGFEACVRFVRATKGATAVEFGLVAVPFIALLLAILQLAVVMIAQQVLQTATSQTSRLIMTGQVQQSGMTGAQFKSQLCTNATALFNCGGLYVTVQTFSSFTGVSMTNPISGGVFNSGSMQFQPGGDGDIVVVQAYYEWPTMLPAMGFFNLSNLNDGNLLLVSTAAFRNEPF